MTREQVGKWGERYGINAEQVVALRQLINKRGEQQMHYCNGDRHPLNRENPADKNRNAELWDYDSEITAIQLDALAEKLGFEVDYGVGLYAVLMKNGEDCIIVPE